MSNFRIGQKVEYVFEKIHDDKFGHITPDPGVVYTVRGVGLIGDEPGILLREIRNKPMLRSNGFGELLMNSRFFRPVVDRPTDISVFTAMLNPSKAAERV